MEVALNLTVLIHNIRVLPEKLVTFTVQKDKENNLLVNNLAMYPVTDVSHTFYDL